MTKTGKKKKGSGSQWGRNGVFGLFAQERNPALQRKLANELMYGNLLQYSCLENPMDRGAWQAIVSP